MILQRTQPPEDWKAHLAQPEKHWKPGYSAMETALSWETAEGLPTEVRALFPTAHLLQAIVEYPVALPSGRTDSMNDVFALLADDDGLVVCMVEAKRNEPFGDTINDWMRTQSVGKTERFAFLCETLGLRSDAAADTLRYQLFHRTASAILTARQYRARRAVMLVQSFSPEQKWFSDYAAFTALFGLTAQPDTLQDAGQIGETRLSFGWITSPLTGEVKTC